MVETSRTFGAEEASRDVDRFTSNDDDFLTVQKLLCDDASESSVQVALPVDNDLNLLVSDLQYYAQ